MTLPENKKSYRIKSMIYNKILRLVTFRPKVHINLWLAGIYLLILLQSKGHTQTISLPIQRDDIEQVWSFIDIDLNKVDKYGNTVLHTAASRGQIDIIESLIALQITQTMNIHQTDHFGNTPLNSAIRSGHKAISQMLIDLGMDVNTTNRFGTPLHNAARLGKINLVKLLIDSGADLNKRDSFGKTPLHDAARSRKNEVVGLLLSHGADLDNSYEPSDYNEELLFYLENIDSEFLPYIHKYESLKGSSIRDNIRFAFEHHRYLAGRCIVTLQTIGIRWILIDLSFWHNSSPSERESVIFHELGHCDLNREHENKRSSSIMDSGQPLLHPQDFLYRELFSKRNTSKTYTQWDTDEAILKKFNQIKQGMSAFEVLNIVGEPLFVGQREQDYWRYSFYQHRFWKEIEFNQNKQVTDIKDYKIAIYPDI